jgi:hypothetical protein
MNWLMPDGLEGILKQKVGESLELGGLAGPDPKHVFARLFDIFNGSTVMQHTHVAVGSATGFSYLRTFDVEIADMVYRPETGLLCLSGQGALVRYADERWTSVAGPIEPFCRVSQLVPAGGALFALGPANGVYRFGNDGIWQKLPVPDEDVIILDIASLADGTLLICGTDGYLAKVNGASVDRIDLPTDAHLCGIYSSAGSIWVCGYGALLFHFDGQDWEQIDAAGAETDFLRFSPFSGKLLMSAETAIYEVLPDQILRFAEVDNRRLSVIGDTLFCSDPYSAHQLHASGWSILEIEIDIPEIPPQKASPKE